MEDVMGADAPDDIGFTIMEVEAIDASAEPTSTGAPTPELLGYM